MRATPVFILWVILSGQAQGVIRYREHFSMMERMTWSDAQNHCRQHYHDLSTITDAAENAVLTYAQKQGWIGLHRNADNIQDWYWSDGDDSSYRNWNDGELNNNNEHCARIHNGIWYTSECDQPFPFICYNWRSEVVLVQEKMSWEEALLHCRKEQADLASLLTDREAAVADAMANEAHTPLVWTSLHFLAGEWLWVSESNHANQEFTQGSLPSCPVQNHRCGARRPSDGQWENRDCQEKLYFFCYKA